MASTYSNLKIQLMATGENSTTWGNVTNTNLGTAIEEAITGSADVAFSSADVTLTLTDTNASQTARNLRLNLTGTSGGARNLVVPSIEKVYIVKNGLADAVTVKTLAGTGIAVPSGKTMWVFSDATNVVDVTTYLSSLTLGTPLAVAQGGTGGNTQASAQTALGVPSATGTGASGTWAINISGSAASATSATTAASATTAGSVTNSVTFSNTGGAAVGTTFNGSAAKTVDYSTLGAPKADGTGATGTWAINVSGSAATATSATSATTAGTATNATNLVTANFSIVESGGVLYIKYGSANIAKITSAGAFTALNNVTGYGTV